MKITVKNYRAFADERPATWSLGTPFTAFVGINNAGKSSLLRFFHEVRESFRAFERVASDDNARRAFHDQPFPLGFLSVADTEEVFHNGNERDMMAEFSLPPETPANRSEPTSIVFRWRRPDGALSIRLGYDSSEVEVTEWEDGSPIVEVHGVRTLANISRYVAAMSDLANSLYLGPFRNAVNVGGSASYYDLQIGESFISQWDDMKTGNQRRRNLAAVAVESELAQIFGLQSLQINAAPRNETLQVIADGRPYQLQEHGAGFAQFVLVLAFIAVRKPAWVMIDEPELNLHPALQLDFLTTLAKYTEHGVVFATHSIGLARAAAQAIYSVRRTADGNRDLRDLEATANLAEFLGELGLSGYQELGFKQVLLVEGTTEVTAIQRLLRLYGVEHEIVLLPLGGSSMIHPKHQAALAEIQRVTTRVSVLIDSEKTSADEILSATREGFVEMCEKLGFKVHVLERRAFENYLTDAAVKAAKGDEYSALGPYQKLSEAPRSWAKSENWRIAAQMKKSDLEGTDLGDFLKNLAAEPSTHGRS